MALTMIGTAANARITDATGDFVSTFTGTKTPDLDVVSSDVFFDGTNFTFTATLAGAVTTSTGASYVWGVDRGTGSTTSNFAAIGLPNVIFDSVVILRPDTTATVTRQGTGGTSTPFGAGTATVSGNSISATIAATELPTKGFAPGAYTWNLWPRLPNNGTANISDFAPNANNAGVVAVPEARTLVLLAPGLFAAFGVVALRRRK